MPVLSVQDSMEVRPNCTDIIPPNRDPELTRGRLRLLDPAAPRGRHRPIDRFLTSLAQDQHERAIAVVLTGTGSDGTAGVRAVKAEGGMMMVQSAATAAYSGMRARALATGLVDDDMAPAAMPAKLMAYAARADEREADQGTASSQQDAKARLLVLLHSHCGHDFSQYKPNTIQHRVQGRLAACQITKLDDYILYARHDPSELDALLRDLLIGVTRFLSRW